MTRIEVALIALVLSMVLVFTEMVGGHIQCVY